MNNFEKYPSIPRLTKNIIITEKLDGTNAQIFIGDNGEFITGSRNRVIIPGDDNYGFAAWAYSRKEEIISCLGPGRYFGEWWGSGIQRKYGLNEKRFTLFNPYIETPECISTIPILYEGLFDTEIINNIMETLHDTGSIAAPGYMNPEGIVIYHTASKQTFKKTFDFDEGKWSR